MSETSDSDSSVRSISGGGISESAPKPAYPPPARSPTQEGPRGLRYDFNLGCRVVVPPQEDERALRIRLRDLKTGNTLFETTLKQGFVNSNKRWFVRLRIEVWDGDDRVFLHDYDARNRPILVQFPVGTLGDTIGWFPYAARFAAEHGCKLTCAMSDLIIPLFREAYPDIEFITHEEVEPDRFYATYCLGLFFNDLDAVWQPTDFRMVGLHRTAGYILGVNPAEEAPKLGLPDNSRPIPEPYVCIGVQSSSGCKYWNNPNGWRAVVQRLKEAGIPGNLHRPKTHARHGVVLDAYSERR